MKYFPINLNVDGRRAVVIGGGRIALRKVNALVDCGADVVVVSPEFCPELADMPGITQIERCYEMGDLDNAAVVISATDSEAANRQVWEDATAAGIPVNVVDQPERCTFTVPAVFRRGDIMIAISTGGAGPALSGSIRRRLDVLIGPEYADLLELLKPMRRRVRKTDLTFEQRARLMRAMSAEDVLDVLRNDGPEPAQALLDKMLEKALAQR
ncbi:MAG: bifunctional precorrin-2 dehydrogenase/sirohydrochlorin ferrochelatase [Lentisphaerae bacterium]|nr:bifunctional precorrin-2 dehydrogenase/sirohydrochlorin ferrochelatase [Lentisphaerota bacterium]MBT5610962.1 bifunctional precorrin-2 dehydrogenase/sirohydrochlorin ferrochelatase [Lentisphaerota bacterium]MBT7062218.1 bifunctional precorrin-2 dehydrogenase/sirohydrochlorin ferrochelatase [Lentisphaerota bacterium]MBT7848058.1 bifunctional precorrin-2 dehydrogenase/sirohydrochlorin ferrochelatase [Lentisphaerota bacterium]